MLGFASPHPVGPDKLGKVNIPCVAREQAQQIARVTREIYIALAFSLFQYRTWWSQFSCDVVFAHGLTDPVEPIFERGALAL